jgi:hypothetical protein
VIDSASPPSPLAALLGPVTCHRGADALTLSGAAADSADDMLILTFIAATVPDLPGALDAATISALDRDRYRIASGSGEWVVGATSLHVHRDIGRVFYRAIPPRAVPLRKRLFWRGMLALAGTSAGKRLLLSLRRWA